MLRCTRKYRRCTRKYRRCIFDKVRTYISIFEKHKFCMNPNLIIQECSMIRNKNVNILYDENISDNDYFYKGPLFKRRERKITIPISRHCLYNYRKLTMIQLSNKINVKK